MEEVYEGYEELERDLNRRLERELWDCLMRDPDGVEMMLMIKKRDDRRGRLKRLLCKAVEDSSLGMFAGKMYFFGGKVYTPIERFTFHKVLFSICSNRIKVPDADLVGMGEIYMDCSNVIYSKQLRISNNVMIFANGVLDVERNKFFKRFDPRHIQMWAVDYEYDRTMRTYKWNKFLDEVLPDKYWQESLQMFLGATFVDREKVKIEHIVILLGKGANGKSVIQQAVCGVLGHEYVSTIEIGRLCARGLEGDMAVAECNGKRLNYCTEMEETDFFKKSARLKAVVSGEDVTARQMYGSPFKARNIPLLMANANQLPYFNRKDEAMLRRIYVIPFEVTIPEEKQNKYLSDELVEEYPGILNWILEGRKKFIANGCRLPTDTCLERNVEEQHTEFNSVLKFMSVRKYKPKVEGTSVEPFMWRRLADLYPDYVRWAKANGFEGLVSKSQFSDVLADNGYKRDRRSYGICFAIFTNAKEKIVSRENRMKYPEKGDVRMMWVDGVPYLTSMRRLSDFVGVSVHVLNRLKTSGAFDGCIKQYEKKNCYQVTQVVEVLKRMRILASDEEKDAQRKMDKSLKRERDQFNARMKAREWPFRKYATGGDRLEEGIIVVSDFLTDEEAVEMAREQGYDITGVKGVFKNSPHMIDNPNDEQKEYIDKNNIQYDEEE